MTPQLQSRIKALQDLNFELGTINAKESLDANDNIRVKALMGENGTGGLIDQAEEATRQAKAASDRQSSVKSFLEGDGIKSVGAAPNDQSREEFEIAFEERMERGRATGRRFKFDQSERAGTELMGRTRAGDFKSIDSDGWGLTDKQIKVIREPRYKTAFENIVIRGRDDRADYKALIEGVDTDGGFLAPPEYIAELISRLPYPTEILGRVRTVPCSRDRVIWPRLNYDSNTQDIYTSPVRMTFGSDQSSSAEIDPSFGDVEIPVWAAQFPIEVNRGLLEDQAIPVSSIVQELASEAYTLGMDNYIISGTGVNQPLGLITNAGNTGLYLPTLNMGNPVTADGISDLILTLPPQYRRNFDSTCAVMNATSAFANFAKLKDNSGQYIFGLMRNQGPGSMVDPRMQNIFGYDVIYSAFMPNVGAGNSVALFGDLRQTYIHANRIGLTVYPYGDQDKGMLSQQKVGWYFRVRAGGNIVQNRASHVGVQS